MDEAAVVQDLLNILMGYEGEAISYRDTGRPRIHGAKYSIDRRIDRSLAILVDKFFPLASAVVAVSSFITEFSDLPYGKVNHALTEALSESLGSFYNLVASLENVESVQKLWLYVQDSIKEFSVLVQLIDAIVAQSSWSIAKGTYRNEVDTWDGDRDVSGSRWYPKGGQVLALLESVKESTLGDVGAQDVIDRVYYKAAVPYIGILSKWMTQGVLHDPFDEVFFRCWTTDGKIECGMRSRVQLSLHQSSLVNRTLPPVGGSVVPAALHKHAEKILLVGKYVGVIRQQCPDDERPDVASSNVEEPGFQSDIGAEAEIDPGKMDGSFQHYVDICFARTNGALMRLFFEDLQVGDRLNAARELFFMCNGEVFSEFLESSLDELLKKAKTSSVSKVLSYLELAYTSSDDSALALLSDKSNLQEKSLRERSMTIPQSSISVHFSKDSVVDWVSEIFSTATALAGEETAPSEPKAPVTKPHELLALDALNLHYDVPAPYDMILTRLAMARYELIFRQLLRFKALELRLQSLWASQKRSALWTGKSAPAVDTWKCRFFALRAAIYAFVQQLYAYFSQDILENHWRKFCRETLARSGEIFVTTLQDAHIAFLDNCIAGCMLTNSRLLKAQDKLYYMCCLFVASQAKFTSLLAGMNDDQSLHEASNLLARYEGNFHNLFSIHFDMVLNESEAQHKDFAFLVSRLAPFTGVV